jgi:hypothetical protein
MTNRERAIEAANRFMDTGEGEYSCNECETDVYLCPHLFDRLVNEITAALDARLQDGEPTK